SFHGLVVRVGMLAHDGLLSSVNRPLPARFRLSDRLLRCARRPAALAMGRSHQGGSMLFRSLAAAAALIAVAAPAAVAQEVDLRAQVAVYGQPSNEARTRVVVDQLRAAGFEATGETFAGGHQRTGQMECRNVVAVIGEGPREILLTAHYDAV